MQVLYNKEIETAAIDLATQDKQMMGEVKEEI